MVVRVLARYVKEGEHMAPDPAEDASDEVEIGVEDSSEQVDSVQEADEESFPASDPSSSWAGLNGDASPK